MKKRLLNVCLLLGTVLLASCAALGLGGYGGGYGNAIGTVTSGTVKGQFHVQLVECVGNASAQSVTAVLSVTNTGPNAFKYIGGSLDGSLAIDNFGATSKPYGSAGQQYDLPSGVVVRVEIPRIEPVRPGAEFFQILSISMGGGKDNMVSFRNVPIVWTN